jgi:hypothetical protein
MFLTRGGMIALACKTLAVVHTTTACGVRPCDSDSRETPWKLVKMAPGTHLLIDYYPPTLRRAGIQGRVLIGFNITSGGKHRASLSPPWQLRDLGNPADDPD